MIYLPLTYQAHDDDSPCIDNHSQFFLDSAARYFWVAKHAAKADVLDCGCGKGFGSYVLSKDAHFVHAIDLNKKSLNLAKSLFQAKNLFFEESDVLELSKIEAFFDIVTAFELIEHLPPEKSDIFLSNLGARLKKDGQLFLSTPNHNVVTKSGVAVPNFHINNFTPSDLKTLLKKHFRDVTLIGQFKKRPFIEHLFFTIDVFNIRHLLQRLCKKSKIIPTHTGICKEALQTDITHLFNDTFQDTRHYVFSKYHWRQAGLTVAICSKPK